MKWSWFKSTQQLYHIQLYDDATRGPWGALKFLIRVKDLYV